MLRIVFLFLLFSISVSAQKIDRKIFYEFNENVDFRVYNMSKSRTTSRNHLTYIAKKGQRYISMTLELRNNSSETQIVDFRDFYLLDANSKLNELEMVIKAMKLSANPKQFEQKIKPNKKIKVGIEFKYPISKEEIIKTIVIDGRKIELELKS